MLKNQKTGADLFDTKREAEVEKRLLESAQMEQELEKPMHEKRLDIIKRQQHQQTSEFDELVVDTADDMISKSSNVLPQKLDGLLGKRRQTKDENSKTFASNFTSSSLKLPFNNTEEDFLTISALPSSSPFNRNYICLNQSSCQFVAVSEWKLCWINNCQNLFQKEVQTIEDELKALIKLDHSHLLRYLSFSVHNDSNNSCSTIRVFKSFPHVGLFPVSFMLDRKIAASLSYIQSMSVGVLAALEYLHSKGVVHKDIGLDCIFDCGSSIFMLADFSIRKRISDLVQTFKNNIRSVSTIEMNQPISHVGMGKTGQKADVFMVGKCCFALASGADLPANAPVNVLDVFPNEFRSFMRMMVCEDEDERLTAAQLLKHEFLQGEFGQGGKNDLDAEKAKEWAEDVALSVAFMPQKNRLENEFDSSIFLGRGGFGDVQKVRNKLDDCFYAVKRIILKPCKKEENVKIMREVKLLSTFNHENVVRYFNVWIEHGVEEKSVPSEESDSPSDDDDSSDNVVDNGQVHILHIQMEYCEKGTLRQVIDNEKLFADPTKAWRLLREIIEGLAYIHKQNVIHRDLKPENIFMDSDNHVKIGDFGFAIKGFFSQAAANASGIADIHTSASFVDSVKNELSEDFAFSYYKAPELASSGSSKKLYTQRVDIYSVGIIFFEMCNKPFGTGMERCTILSPLRASNVSLPPNFASNEKLKRQVDLIKRLLSHDVESRPDAEELLGGNLLPPLEMQQSDFQMSVNGRYILAQKNGVVSLQMASLEK